MCKITYIILTIIASVSAYAQIDTAAIRLNMNEYIVQDTGKYDSFFLKLQNPTDSLVIIDRVEPSCGCILATVQKSYATKKKDGEIYVAVTVERMSDLQPFTINVYTNIHGDRPLRLYLRKASSKATEE